MEVGQKVYFTKYALTDGIVLSHIVCRSTYGVSIHWPRGWNKELLAGKREVFADREAAIQKFEAMRAKRIASLKKQIAKLEKMEPTFQDYTAEGEQ